MADIRDYLKETDELLKQLDLNGGGSGSGAGATSLPLKCYVEPTADMSGTMYYFKGDEVRAIVEQMPQTIVLDFNSNSESEEGGGSK